MKTDLLSQRLAGLFEQGKLVHLNVSKWGMTHTLDEEKDLGIKAADVPAFVLPGKKKLFPDEIRLKFGRIESRAREHLRANSHKFPVADAHFVPQKKIVQLINELMVFKTEYDAATADFIANYEKYKEEMLTKHPNHKDSLAPYYPPIEQVATRFSFNIKVFEISFPKEVTSMTMTDILAQNIAVEEMQKKFATQIMEQKAETMREVESFVKDSVMSLRTQIVEVFQRMATKIENKEVISHTNIKTIRSVIDDFDGLDFFDDSAVGTQLAKIRQLVKKDIVYKDNDTAVAELKDALGTALQAANKMTDIDQVTGEYFRRLDLSDDT